jgi:hypothetical protein
MKFLPWEPTDMMWDTDITPEGGLIQLSKKLGSKMDIWMNGMAFVMTETEPATHNSAAFAVQPGFGYQLTDNISLKGAFSYYDFMSVKGKALDGSTSTNTRRATSAGGGLMYGFRNVSPALQIGFKDPLKNIGLGGIPILGDAGEFALFGEYLRNVAAPGDNAGYGVGFSFGAPKIESFGQWKFKYIYGMLERNAVLDTLPDSDRYGGKTGIRSHEGVLEFGLGKNTWLSFDAYRSWNIASGLSSGRKAPTTVVQVDWNMKF